MTAQMNDVFKYHGVDYALAGISQGELFNPAMFGLHPMMASTACWRGFIATYTIADSHLILDALSVNLHEMDSKNAQTEGPLINGIKPVSPIDKFRLFNNLYTNLNYHIRYTGGVLIGSGFIRELYVHMGFHPAWKYETVFELIFEDGILKDEFDRSKQMGELRKMIQESPAGVIPGRMPTQDQISEFVKRSFDRSYTTDE